MAKKVEKVIPWITILAICLMVFTAGGMVLKEAGAAGVTPSAQVNNIAPTVGAITLNSGDPITVVGNSSTTITGTATITDTNGWDDISSATATLFHNTTTCTGADADPNDCYLITSSDCTLGATTANSRDVSCAIDVWFVAQPTTGTGTVSGAQDWEMDITATDAGSNTDTATSAGNSVELNTLYYSDITSTITYGTMDPGATSSDKTTTATNQGNSPIDFELSGVDMEDGSGHTIIPDQQHYSDASIQGDWGGTALTSTVASIDLNLPKPTATTSNSADDIYWVIKIPSVQAAGTYTGTNTASIIDAKVPPLFCSQESDYNSTSTVSGDLVYCDNSGRLWTPTAVIGGSATTYQWGGKWTDEPTDSCIGVASRPACNYCDDLTYAGYSNWELPSCTNDDNLPDSCVLYQFGADNCGWNGGNGGQSSCNPSWDSNAQSLFYWSSTEYNSTYAWSVSFTNGYVDISTKDFGRYVRCVRGQ